MKDSASPKAKPEETERSNAALRKGDVIVLGAGFSSALTDKAPLMKGFLETSLAMGVYDPERFHMELAKAIVQYFGGKIGDINIEELATFLADESIEDWLTSFSRKAANDQLIWVIANTLATAWDGAQKSPSLQFARSIARRCIDEQLPIVTLNYDLIVDNLLHETKQWSPDFGYGTRLRTPFDDVFNELDKAVPGSSAFSASSRTVLLKLHGSLNWGIRRAPHPDGTTPVEILSSDKMELLALRQGNKLDVPPIARTINTVYQTPYAPGLAGNPNMRFEPLIVPPLSTKQAASEHPFLSYCQYLARDAFSNAQRIIVVGYSLPAADFGIRSLFRAATGRLTEQGQLRGNRLTVLIVDRSDEVVTRFRDLFASFARVEVIHPYRDCIDWLRDAGADLTSVPNIEYPTGGLDFSKPVYSRPDGTYVVTHNSFPYCVLKTDQLYARVKEYDRQHPGAVQPELPQK